jgi:methyl-accepting chemotaxis protein
MNFKSLTVAKRLYAGFGFILAILTAVTLVAIVKVGTIDVALRANSEQNLLVQRYAINFRGSAHNRSIAIRDVVLSNELPDRQRELADIKQLAEFYAQSAGPLEQLISAPGAPPELARLYADIKNIETQTVATTNAIEAAIAAGDAQGAQTMLWTQAKPQYVTWLADINKLIDFEEVLIKAANKTALEQAGGFVPVMLGALLMAILAGSALAFTTSRSIISQLGAEPASLGESAQRVARGELTPIPGAQRAPAGSVLASLGTMQANLANIVGQVRGASESIATGSAEIAMGNADLSHRTEEQASALQETATTMDQLGTTVRHNTESAKQANQMADGASQVASKGGEVVSRVVDTMKGINDSSKRIADIIGVIDGIAFQTNILALNAAVEAARAGEQGRGFAVVASEVRSLAQRSAAAAKEIKGLITSSVEQVEQGTTLVDEAGRTMAEIVGAIKRVTEIVSEISSASVEQSSGVSLVGQSVSRMDQATQQNAALVEQSAAAAESLRQQAERLVDVVSVFKLAA